MEKNTKSAQDFYNQEAQTYKKMYEPGYEYYPANLIRLKLIIKRLKNIAEKTTITAVSFACFCLNGKITLRLK